MRSICGAAPMGYMQQTRKRASMEYLSLLSLFQEYTNTRSGDLYRQRFIYKFCTK